MVREGRILIVGPNASDPDFGANYIVTAYTVGAQVVTPWNGGFIEVAEGHGFTAARKFIVVSEFPNTTKMRTVTSVTADRVYCDNVLVAAGDILVNLGIDSEFGAGVPDYDGSDSAIYTDMDYQNLINFSEVTTDSTGRYRYFYNIIPRWELVRTSSGVPIALIMDTGDSGIGGETTTTDTAIARWDGTAGQGLTDSVILVSDTNGDMSGGRHLAISGNFTGTGDVNVGDDLTVTGTSALQDVTVATTLNVTGAVDINGAIDVAGATVLQGSASVGTTLSVTGAASLGSTLTVSGNITGAGHLRGLLSTSALVSSSNITTAGKLVIDITNTSGTNTFTISAPSSVNGQLLILRCVALTAGTMTLADSGSVSLSAAWVPNADDTLTLVASGSVWYEIARSVN